MPNIIEVTKSSGIPLIGTMYFGIMDRNTDIIELRPTTLCSLSCIFCSVGAGPASSYKNDFVVDKSYLVDELKKVLGCKGEKIDIWINPQGEPLLYPELTELIADIRKLDNAGKIVVITNAALLTEKKVDELKLAGLDQINISLCAFSQEKAKELAGCQKYDLEHIKRIAEYISRRMRLSITPVYIKSMNEGEMDSLIQFSKDIGAEISIQNFLRNKKGRNPTAPLSWKNFRKRLEALEKKHSISLLKLAPLKKTKPLPKAARKGSIVEAEIICEGKFDGEAIASFNGRSIVVYGAKRLGKAKVRIIKASNNIYYGKSIG